MKVEIDADEAISKVKLDITVVGGDRSILRVRLAMLVLRFAAWLMPTDTQIIIGEPEAEKRIRPSANPGEPPVAYDVEARDFDPFVGGRLRVFLDGVEQRFVVAYDCEQGWVERYRQRGSERSRLTGNVKVEWRK